MITAIIPAKSKSTRIPNKNTIDLGGKPLFQWTFDICQKIKAINKVIVATDSKRIAKEANKNNYEVYPLSEEDIEEKRTVDGLWKEIAEKHKGIHLVLQPTSPFRDIKEIKSAINLYETKKYDFIFAVKLVEDLIVNDFGKNHKDLSKRLSQNEKPLKIICGNFYLSHSEYIKNNNNLQKGNLFPFVVKSLSSIDIDTIDDLEYARIIAKGLA